LDLLLRIINIFVQGAFHAQKNEEEAATLSILKRNQSQQKPEAQTFISTDSYKTPEKQVGIPFVNAGSSHDVAIGPDLPPGF